MKATLKELFTNEFGLDTELMEVNKPYPVDSAKIGIKSLDEDTGTITLALVTSAIKKEMQDSVRIKLAGRDEWELPVANRHMYGINKKDDGSVDYAYAEDLRAGLKVLTETGYVEIEAVEPAEKQFVFDIETDAGNYYTNGVLSHNSLMSHLPSQTGGTAIKFFSSTRNRITKIEQLKGNDGNDAGIKIRVRNYKNKTGIPWRDAEMNLFFDRGFDSDSEYFDFLVIFGFLQKGNGGVYSADFLPNGKIRGADNVKAWLAENRDVYEPLKKKVDEKLMQNNELDADNTNPELNELADVSKSTGIDIAKLAEEAAASQEEERALASENGEEVPPDLGL